MQALPPDGDAASHAAALPGPAPAGPVPAAMPRHALRRGFPEARRGAVASMFCDAFSDKLGLVLGPRDRAQAFLAEALQPRFALSVCDAAGRVLGIAGLKTAEGGLLGGGMAELRRVYGPFGALWRGPLLDLLERPVPRGEMQLDGLFVAAHLRGRGLGTMLIEAVAADAARRGLARVRLDVAESNDRARALYEARGFRAAGKGGHGVTHLVLGIGGATRMFRDVAPAGPGRADPG